MVGVRGGGGRKEISGLLECTLLTQFAMGGWLGVDDKWMAELTEVSAEEKDGFSSPWLRTMLLLPVQPSPM